MCVYVTGECWYYHTYTIGPCSFFEMYDETDSTCTSVVRESEAIDWYKVRIKK